MTPNPKLREMIMNKGIIPEDEHYSIAEQVIQECIDVVLNSDPSPKMIAHEPYRTIMNNIMEHFGVEE